MTIRYLPVLVIGVVALVHLPGLESGFHYDDGHSLLRNPHIRSLGNLTAFFTDPQTFSENPEYAMYRPLVLLTYAANYALVAYDANGYHLLNLILHCGLTWSMLILSCRLGLQRPVAALCALAIGLHHAGNRANQLRQQSV
jgi:hypothetical protein